eukprot:gb/GEZN01004047.1/.p1 GENE.gb/GEZN01004047.1/~~gb/GEZN01004047.1/.p1  ORF type:complete len:593 (-),score=72.27 gb/GEZN01004047.1/:259-2004(-)
MALQQPFTDLASWDQVDFDKFVAALGERRSTWKLLARSLEGGNVELPFALWPHHRLSPTDSADSCRSALISLSSTGLAGLDAISEDMEAPPSTPRRANSSPSMRISFDAAAGFSELPQAYQQKLQAGRFRASTGMVDPSKFTQSPIHVTRGSIGSSRSSPGTPLRSPPLHRHSMSAAIHSDAKANRPNVPFTSKDLLQLRKRSSIYDIADFKGLHAVTAEWEEGLDGPSKKDSPNKNKMTKAEAADADKRRVQALKSLDGAGDREDHHELADVGPEMVVTKSLLRAKKGRRFAQYACVSKAGSAPYTPSKINQDRGLVLVPFAKHPSNGVFGVFDGHGQNGHLASEFIVERFDQIFQSKLEQTKGDVPKAAFSTCADLDQSLITDKKFGGGMDFSGSTGVVVFIEGDQLWTINVGDSRAVLGKDIGGGRFEAINLSHDHTGIREDETKRIVASGGRVCPAPDWDDGPLRVWLAQQDLPGLAMTRSFGDTVASSVGVVSEPEVVGHKLTDKDRFMILASDGIWEFISSQEAIDMVAFMKEQDAEAAIALLIDAAVQRWTQEEEVVDDITCIVVFFSDHTSSI